MRTNHSKDRGVKEKILALRKEGRSYNSISKDLNVSKGSVSYHCGEGQKKKAYTRLMKRKEGICGKIYNFIYTPRRPYNESPYTLGPIRKKARNFVYGKHAVRKKASYKENKEALKHPNQKVWSYLGKIFPGIKSEQDDIQALNQWTNKPDFENNKPLRFPYMRCKINGNVYNVKGSDIEADHIDGDRRNNHIDNFSFIHSTCNQMKGRMRYKKLYETICKVKKNLEKYKEFWNK